MYSEDHNQLHPTEGHHCRIEVTTSCITFPTNSGGGVALFVVCMLVHGHLERELDVVSSRAAANVQICCLGLPRVRLTPST